MSPTEDRIYRETIKHLEHQIRLLREEKERDRSQFEKRETELLQVIKGYKSELSYYQATGRNK